jgi:hypothetical protein
MQPYTSLPCKHYLPGIVPFTCSYMGRPQLESSIRGARTMLLWLFLPCSLTFHYFAPPFTILCASSLCHVFYCFSHTYLPFHNVKQIFCPAIHFDLIWGKHGHHCVVIRSYIGLFNCTKSTCTFLCAQFYHPRKCLYILSPSCDCTLVALTQIILVVEMLKFSIFTFFQRINFKKWKWRIFTMKNTQWNNTMETQFNTQFKWLLYLTNIIFIFLHTLKMMNIIYLQSVFINMHWHLSFLSCAFLATLAQSHLSIISWYIMFFFFCYTFLSLRFVEYIRICGCKNEKLIGAFEFMLTCEIHLQN